MSILKTTTIEVSGNRFIRRMLERNVQASQYLMGIGSGGGILSSGEQALFRVPKQKIKLPYCVIDVGSVRNQYLCVPRKLNFREKLAMLIRIR
jgi:hypothetical protein